MKIIENALERFSLPAEAGGAARLCLSGKTRLSLENHRGLLELRDDCAVISSSAGNIRISGEGLSVRAMERGSLVISGNILRIDLE